MIKFEMFNRYREVVAGYSTRIGGVSEGRYASLNLGLHVGDERDAVVRNRELFCQSLGVDFGGLTCADQCHSNHVELVQADRVGWGNDLQEDAVPQCDGLYTAERGATLVGFSADCPIIVAYDPEHRAIGLAHAGWRGVAKQIIPNLVAGMVESFGTRPKALLAAVGPAIAADCYPIGEDVVNAMRFVFKYSLEEVLVSRNGQAHFNLAAACRLQLLHSGVEEDNIELARRCTHCDWENLYSYRRDGAKTGRFGVAIALY